MQWRCVGRLSNEQQNLHHSNVLPRPVSSWWCFQSQDNSANQRPTHHAPGRPTHHAPGRPTKQLLLNFSWSSPHLSVWRARIKGGHVFGPKVVLLFLLQLPCYHGIGQRLPISATKQLGKWLNGLAGRGWPQLARLQVDWLWICSPAARGGGVSQSY